MESNISLSTNLVNGILQYLGTQPYTQVVQLIQGIQQEAQAQATQPEKVEAEPVN